ncbi:hypothetical protein RvY_16143 [Ramazzottius varieornatus]|uniref:SEA domain-containing protein n=1 Tax=Ramazzottius varieornatus TaxID=947166 RepID=A0A1D1VYE2_RAMVA|nr:hypothetical protein RvY_16143 [Ramazzottius varieornatus]
MTRSLAASRGGMGVWFLAVVAITCSSVAAVQGLELTEERHEVHSWNVSLWTAYSTYQEQQHILELCRQLWAYALDCPVGSVALTLQQAELIQINGIVRKNAKLYHLAYSVETTFNSNITRTAANQTYQDVLVQSGTQLQVDLGLSVSAWIEASKEWAMNNANGSVNSTTAVHFLDHYRPHWQTFVLFDVAHIDVSAAGTLDSTEMSIKLNDSEITESRVVDVLHGTVMVYNISRMDAVTKNISTVIVKATQFLFDEKLESQKGIMDVKLTFGILQSVRHPTSRPFVNEFETRYQLTFTVILNVKAGNTTWEDNRKEASRSIWTNRWNLLLEGLSQHSSNLTASKGWLVSFSELEAETDASPPAKLAECRRIPYVLFDSVNLAYGSDRVPTSALGALVNIWTLVLGRKASQVTVALSRIASEVSFSLAGDQGLPINKLFLRVTFTSTHEQCPPADGAEKQAWNTIELKKAFREKVQQARNEFLLLSNTELLDFSFYNDAVTTAQTASGASVAASPISSTTASSAITTTGNPARTSPIQENILLCYPNETERNRQLASLRQIWADAFGQDIFDVRLSVTHDVLVSGENTTSAPALNVSVPTPPANASSTNETGKPLFIHQVQYIVIPSNLDVQRLNLSSARSRYYELLAASSLGQQQENCTALASSLFTDTNVTSTTAPSSTHDFVQFNPRKTRRIIMTIINDSTVLQYHNLGEKNYALTTIRQLWASAFNYSLQKTILKVRNEEMLGPSVHQIDYSIQLIGHSDAASDYPDAETVEAAQQYFGQFFPKPTTTSPTTTLATTSEPVKAATPYLFYDSLRLTYRTITQRDGALTIFQKIWRNVLKSACANCTSRMVVYDENPVFVPEDILPVTTSSPSPANVRHYSKQEDDEDIGQTHTIFYVVIVVSTLPDIDFVQAKEDFRQTVFNTTDFPYIVNFANVYPSPKPRSIQTVVILTPASADTNSSQRLQLKTEAYQKLLGKDFVWLDVWDVRFPANTAHTKSPLESEATVLTDTFEITALITTNMRISPTDLQNAV